MKKLLIIEDDPYVRRLYRRLFVKQGFDLILTDTGQDGLEKAKTTNPGLILIDILMKPMSGLQVLKRIKSDPQIANIPVVMLTNVEDTRVMEEAKRDGAQGFIVKSQHSPEEILSMVETSLGK